MLEKGEIYNESVRLLDLRKFSI